MLEKFKNVIKTIYVFIMNQIKSNGISGTVYVVGALALWLLGYGTIAFILIGMWVQLNWQILRKNINK